MGMTKLEILRETPKRSSAASNFGYADSELAVANASRKASLINRSKKNTLRPRNIAPASISKHQSSDRPI
ncbi:hypothetical protein D9M73_278860 [compost metagenome]